MDRHHEHWETDNAEMDKILTTWTAGGNGEIYVDSFQQQRDGGSAWLTLHAHFNSLDACENIDCTSELWEFAFQPSHACSTMPT